ncbi:MAG: hypothetical protein AAGA33_10805 [Pseudomonadota bacterium]
MRWTAIPLSIFVFLLLFALFKFQSDDRDENVSSPSIETLETAQTQTLSSNEAKYEPVVESVACYTEEQIAYHPSFLHELEYLERTDVYGSYTLSYKGLSAEELESLAAQADSGAMAILGARYLLLAHDLDPADAPAFLYFDALFDKARPDREDMRWLLVPRKVEYTEKKRKHMETAVYWFMEAVLHGRYRGLTIVGSISHRLNGKAIEQGWISAEDHAVLSRREQNELFPTNVYQYAGVMLMPEVNDGVLVGIIRSFGLSGERARELALGVVEQVRNEQLARNITPDFPDFASIASQDEILALLCDTNEVVEKGSAAE